MICIRNIDWGMKLSKILPIAFIFLFLTVSRGWSDTTMEGLLQYPTKGSIIQSWPIHFNWNDVGDAYQYNIQIDNNSNFSSPEWDDQTFVSESYVYRNHLPVNTTYYWRVCTEFEDGWGSWCNPWYFTIQEPTDIYEKDSPELPDDYTLDQNYPNPFNPSTTISYYLPKSGKVTLDIYNILGRKIRTLVEKTLKSGYHTTRWDGIDSEGRPVASGIYFYRLKSDKFIQTKKMQLLK